MNEITVAELLKLLESADKNAKIRLEVVDSDRYGHTVGLQVDDKTVISDYFFNGGNPQW